MHLSSDAVIVNQCDRDSVTEKEIDGRNALLKKFKERGYGRLMLFDFSDEKGVQFKELIPERED